MKLATSVLALVLTASCCWATPSAKDQARFKPLIPTGHTLMDTVQLRLQTKADTVAITEKDGKFYLFVLPGGGKSLVSVTTLDKTNGWQTPIQGPHGEKLAQLIYSHDLDRNGHPYLFVHTYLADVTGLHVFKPGAQGYQEVFQENTIAEFSFDAKTGKLSRGGTDVDPAKSWVWRQGKFIPVK